MEEKEPINSINGSSINDESKNKEIKREQEFATLLIDLKTSKLIYILIKNRFNQKYK